jgi:SAM-dependent methyltransferase
MNSIQLTQENSRKYIGYDILFSHDSHNTKRRIIRQILRVSRSGKTIYIDYPALGNKLPVDSRIIKVIFEDDEVQIMKRLEEIHRRREEQRIEKINYLKEQHKDKIRAKIRYLEYELEQIDNLTHEEFMKNEV